MYMSDPESLRIPSDSLKENPISSGTQVQTSSATPFEESQKTFVDSNLPIPSSPMQTLRVGRYELGEEIARGGMGVIYRAWDINLNRPLVLKVLLAEIARVPGMLQRFLSEAQLTAQLQHPGIVPIHEQGMLPDGRPYMAMKLIQGRTLADLLAERLSCKQDLLRFLQIFQSIAQTVAYAHSKRVIHRDLKPLNLMVGAFGEVQVMDWGIAKRLLHQPRESNESTHAEPTPSSHTVVSGGLDTVAGSVIGTLAYMSPEQARGEIDKLDQRSDVFALGAILCEVLTGYPPYVGQTMDSLRTLAVHGDLAEAFRRLDVSEADLELKEWTKRCLAPLVEERPFDAAQVAEAVQTYLANVQERLRAAELERVRVQAQAIEERKRRKIQLILVLCLFVVVLGIGKFFVDQANLRSITARDVNGAIELTRERMRSSKDKDLADDPDLWREKLSSALAALQTAEGLLRSGNPTDDLRQRVDELRSEWEEADRLCNLIAELDRIRMSGIDLISRKWKYTHIQQQYEQAFRNNGWEILGPNLEAMVAILRQHPRRHQFRPILDDWLATLTEIEPKTRLEKLIQLTYPLDHFENRFKKAVQDKDEIGLTRLVNDPEMKKYLAWDGEWFAFLLHKGGYSDLAISLLETALRQHPDSFWLHWRLGVTCFHSQPVRKERGVRSFQVCVALRPRSAPARNNLGVALYENNDLNGAIAEYRQAIDLDPQLAEAYGNLGDVLRKLNDLDGAIVALCKATELDPQNAIAFYNLGVALSDKKDHPGAIIQYQKAIERDPTLFQAYGNLAFSLRRLRKWDEALVAYKEAHKYAHPNRQLQQDIQEEIETTKLLAKLDQKLSLILKGEAHPSNPEERIALAEICLTYRPLPKTAVRFYQEAFDADGKLPHDFLSGYRYDAACAATRAASGDGEDSNDLDEQAKAKLRQQAYSWLKADLTEWKKLVDPNKPEVLQQILQQMQNWLQDSDLSSIREKKSLEALPEAERKEWQTFWTEVEELITKTKPPSKKEKL
jgi:serine/threonine protein kinase/tetratricopeptide (TPR) repeat protein